MRRCCTGAGTQVLLRHCPQEAGIARRQTDLAARVSSTADKYSAVARDATEASGGASITTVYRSAADPAASRTVHTYRYGGHRRQREAACREKREAVAFGDDTTTRRVWSQ